MDTYLRIVVMILVLHGYGIIILYFDIVSWLSWFLMLLHSDYRTHVDEQTLGMVRVRESLRYIHIKIQWI